MGSVAARFSFLLLAAAALTGCLATSPEQQARDALGGTDEDASPEHRPGQPCLLCHSVDYAVDRLHLEVAGTVYLNPTDTVGVAGASVTFVDSADPPVVYQVITNGSGNFMVEVNRAVATTQPLAYPGGFTYAPAAPVFPLQVTEVRTADAMVPCNTDDDCAAVAPRQCRSGFCELANQMTTMIHRGGSCASCHVGDASPTSPGRVYIQAPPAP